jgi:hypothetical protein
MQLEAVMSRWVWASVLALVLSQAVPAFAQEGTEVIPLSRPINTQRFGVRDSVPHGFISAGVGTIMAGNFASSIGGLTGLLVLTYTRWRPTWITAGQAAALSCFAPIAGPIAYGVAALDDGTPGIAIFSFANALAQTIGVVLLIVGGVEQHQARLSLNVNFSETDAGLTAFGVF